MADYLLTAVLNADDVLGARTFDDVLVRDGSPMERPWFGRGPGAGRGRRPGEVPVCATSKPNVGARVST